MREASIAEWLVARLTHRERAEAIVGDLIEMRAEKGSAWFWLSISRIIFSLGWRSPVALAGAFWFMGQCFKYFTLLYYAFAFRHRVLPGSNRAITFAFAIDALIAFVAPYAAVRFGPKDLFTRVSLTFGVVITALLLFWWIPGVAIGGTAATLGIFAGGILSNRWRRALLAFLASLLGGVMAALLIMLSEYFWQVHAYGDTKVWTISWVPECLLAVLVIAIGLICSSVRKHVQLETADVYS